MSQNPTNATYWKKRATDAEAQLGDADARINELDALLREWSSGAKVKGLEARLAEEARVRGLLTNAMREAVDAGCVDHLDCCDDAGEFWHSALAAADALDKERG